MIQKTRAIVLQVTEYAEASIIVHAFTEQNGLQSFLVNSVRKPKARFAANLFQPLSILEIVAYIKKPGGLHRVSDVAASPAFHEIPYDIIKTTVALFLGEVLYRSIREEEANAELFHYVENAILLYDLHPENMSCFHLVFMIGLTRFLGFYPSGRHKSSGPYFDLQEGHFTDSVPFRHALFLPPPTALEFDRLLDISLEDASSLNISGGMRKLLLEAMVLYYELHHTQGKHIRSHQVLSEVLG